MRMAWPRCLQCLRRTQRGFISRQGTFVYQKGQEHHQVIILYFWINWFLPRHQWFDEVDLPRWPRDQRKSWLVVVAVFCRSRHRRTGTGCKAQEKKRIAAGWTRICKQTSKKLRLFTEWLIDVKNYKLKVNKFQTQSCGACSHPFTTNLILINNLYLCSL